LSLEEVSSSLSNFQVLSLNSAKRPGEPIFYGDQILLVNSDLPQWKLSVQNVGEAVIEDGLEVNASEMPRPLKICNYLDNQTRRVAI
jgi:hypothetical protein